MDGSAASVRRRSTSAPSAPRGGAGKAGSGCARRRSAMRSASRSFRLGQTSRSRGGNRPRGGWRRGARAARPGRDRPRRRRRTNRRACRLRGPHRRGHPAAGGPALARWATAAARAPGRASRHRRAHRSAATPRDGGESARSARRTSRGSVARPRRAPRGVGGLGEADRKPLSRAGGARKPARRRPGRRRGRGSARGISCRPAGQPRGDHAGHRAWSSRVLSRQIRLACSAPGSSPRWRCRGPSERCGPVQRLGDARHLLQILARAAPATKRDDLRRRARLDAGQAGGDDREFALGRRESRHRYRGSAGAARPTARACRWRSGSHAGVVRAVIVPSSGMVIWKSDRTSSRYASNSSSARSISSISRTGELSWLIASSSGRRSR